VENLRSRASELRDAAASQTGRIKEAASSAAPGGMVETTRAKVTELVDRSPLPVTLGDKGADSSGQDSQDSLAGVAESAEERLRAEAASADEGADELIDEVATRAGADEPDQMQEERPDRPQEA
jgi:hypothetical protein